MIKADKREDIVVIASEPLTFEKADWLTIPTNTLVVITSKLNVLMYPIVDEFHNPSIMGRAQEQSTVAVVKGEGRGDCARDPQHREVVFVEDHRSLPSVAASHTSTPVLNSHPARFDSTASTQDSSSHIVADAASVMVA